MMQLRVSVAIKLRRWQHNAPEHLLAFSVALGLHVLMLIGINALMNARAGTRSLHVQAVVFDLTPLYHKIINRGEDDSRPRRGINSGPAKNFNFPQPASASIPAPEASDLSALIANGSPEMPSGSLPAGSASTVESTTPLFKTANITPKLIPRRLAMPAAQRKAIVKKVANLMARNVAKVKLDSSLVWEKNGQRFQFNLNHLPASSATGFDELLVGVTTVEGGDSLATQFRMRRTAFSHFAQFVDYWDQRVALHNDEFDGRFHSNSAMVISSSNGTQPQFRGKVTTAGYSIRRSEERSFLDDSKVFLAGLEEGTTEIPLPRIFMGIPRDTSRSAGRIKIFSEESWITFLTDGSYVWHTASSPQREQRMTLSDAPHSIIGQGQARLHVKGVVNGKVLIYSENDIIIDDDLLYAQDPETSLSDDFLGLVSAKDIEVAAPSVTGPGDLKIYAAVLARGRFRVPNLYTRQTGTLHIYGSLSAGSITATEPRYGTRIRFDPRFERMRPPNFPMTNQYEIAEWDERWIVK